ncbi:MAG: hypothetical protein R3C56_21500 [Pirellulaceae bacterium]
MSVTPDRIDVVLNSHSTSPSTVNDLIAAINGNAAASALVIATLDAGSGAAVIGNATTSYSPLRVPPRAFKTFSVSNNTLSYTPAAQYNNAGWRSSTDRCNDQRRWHRRIACRVDRDKHLDSQYHTSQR